MEKSEDIFTNDCFDIVNNRFVTAFWVAYENLFKDASLFGNDELAHKYHMVILRNVPILYSKWLFSALIEETLLTPANLLSAQMEYSNSESSVCSQIYLKSGSATDVFFEFKLTSYDINSHPVIEDLQIFCEHCADGYDLNQNDNYYDYSLLKRFSVPTRQYVSFLADLSLNLKLIKKLPSINSTKVQLTPVSKLFFKKSASDILTAIVKCTIDECVEQFSHMMPVNTYFKKSLFDMLYNPAPTEEFFKLVLSDINIDFEQFIELTHSYEDLNELFSGMMDLTSATFGIGIAFDKYFLTPFGAYLKLIQPVYLLPCSLEYEIRNLINCVDESVSEDTAIYSPCSGYFLTGIGTELFGLDKTDVGEYSLPDNISPKPIFNALKQDDKIPARTLTLMNKKLDKIIVAFTVKSLQLPIKPVTVEIDEIESLETLHECICVSFDLDSCCEYAFFTGNDNSPFSVYSSADAPVKALKSHDALIKTLNLIAKSKIKLVIYDTTVSFSLFSMEESMDVELEIEVKKISAGKYGYLYPREM